MVSIAALPLSSATSTILESKIKTFFFEKETEQIRRQENAVATAEVERPDRPKSSGYNNSCKISFQKQPLHKYNRNKHLLNSGK